jgi:uncharacterized protein YuzE
MKLHYDAAVDAISITLRKGKVSRSVEVSPEIIVDYDRSGNPLYLEILGASEKFGKNLAHVTIGSAQIPFAQVS